MNGQQSVESPSLRAGTDICSLLRNCSPLDFLPPFRLPLRSLPTTQKNPDNCWKKTNKHSTARDAWHFSKAFHYTVV